MNSEKCKAALKQVFRHNRRDALRNTKIDIGGGVLLQLQVRGRNMVPEVQVE